MIRTKRGLDLPISGKPEQIAYDGRPVRTVALLGYDYPGLKPTMEVAEGDKVRAGQVIFTDKKNPGVKYTAPATGTVTAVNRGARRIFQSVVIEIEAGEEESFGQFDPADIATLPREQVVAQLIDSGEWTALRNRPYSKVPAPDDVPRDIFVTAMDTRPLTADPQVFINEHKDAFVAGLSVLTRLTGGSVFVCTAPGADVPTGTDPAIKTETFAGPHPAGLPGTHIHFLSPVSQQRSVWFIDYQNVVAIGSLFTTGKLFHDRIVALGGPGADKPRLLRTRRGASLDELLAGEISEANQRVISGSVLDGRTARGPSAYLGRHHHQVSVLREGNDRELFGFILPGVKKFSVTRLFAGSWLGTKEFALTTNTEGSERAMVPIGSYEWVMPLDVLPTQLLRALLVSDVESAIALGCLELDEDDLALCTFVCPGKYEYGPYLREMLTRIEAEG
ncbi:MAG: Na(+)-translocating NADH-quinone reductase subunit A [Pseudomonadota bacterium]